MNALTTMTESAAAIVERVIIHGDLSKLTPAERVNYYNEVCTSVGLNPLTKPFEYINLNGKLTLYALRACTDQLRTIHSVSVEDLVESERDGVFIVTAKVRNGQGRTDMAKGAVTIVNLKGEALANAMMKAETKAKRRATLSLCGLGWLDESEVDSIPGAVKGEPPSPQQSQPKALTPPPAPKTQPKKVEEATVVNHDPETGEVGPRTLPLPEDKKGAWVPWCKTLIEAIMSSTTYAEVDAWREKNAAALEACEKAAPKAYSSIEKAVAQKADALVKVEKGGAEDTADGAVAQSDADYQDWIRDAAAELDACQSQEAVEDLRERVLAELKPEDQAAWKEVCSEKSAALFKGK